MEWGEIQSKELKTAEVLFNKLTCSNDNLPMHLSCWPTKIRSDKTVIGIVSFVLAKLIIG